MAIAAKRFEIDDNEFNVPVIDFRSIRDSLVRNVGDSAFEYITLALIELLLAQRNITLTDPQRETVKDIINSRTVDELEQVLAEILLRLTTGAITDQVDISSLSAANLTKLESKVLDGMEPARNLLRNSDAEGYNRILSSAIMVPSTPTTITQGEIKTEVTTNLATTNSYLDLINKITGKSLAANVSNEGSTERIVTTVTQEATIKGFTGVYTAFIEKYGETDGVIKAGQSLLNIANRSGQTNLINEILSSSVGPRIRERGMSVVNTALSGIQPTDSDTVRTQADKFESMAAVLNTYDPDWMLSTDTASPTLSINKFSSAGADCLAALGSSVNKYVPAVSNDGIADVLPDEAYLYIGLSMGYQKDPAQQLASVFPEIPLTT